MAQTFCWRSLFSFVPSPYANAQIQLRKIPVRGLLRVGRAHGIVDAQRATLVHLRFLFYLGLSRHHLFGFGFLVQHEALLIRAQNPRLGFVVVRSRLLMRSAYSRICHIELAPTIEGLKSVRIWQTEQILLVLPVGV